MADDDLLDRARRRYDLATEAWQTQRTRELDDLRFQVPELQWPEDVHAQRAGSTENGMVIPPRPMLSIDKIGQPIQLILNQERAAHLGVGIHPLTADATDETAEVLQDLYRAIERDSRADLARSWAHERQVKAGFGAYRVLTEYPTVADDPSDQVIVIKRILNQASAWFDPYAQEPDWSDGRWAFLTADLPFDRYRQDYPDSEVAGYSAMDFQSLSDEQQRWMGGDDVAGRTVRVAEYFEVETVTTQMGDATWSRPRHDRIVHWYLLNGSEVLDQAILPGPYIPLIPVLGKELQPFDGDRRFFGVYATVKDGQRLFNYGVSSAAEKQALATRAPWMVAEGQEEGHEPEFAASTIRNLPMIRYKPTTIAGMVVGPPQRIQASVDLTSDMLLIAQANDGIQASTAFYDPSLGRLKKDQSGVAIQNQQAQANASTSNYLDGLARAMTYEAKVVLSWIPHYYDRPGRIVRARRADQTDRMVMLNAPHTMQEGRPQAIPLNPNGPAPPGEAPKTYDLTKGAYGVAVTIGKRYETQVQQGSDALGEVIKADPGTMMPILGPLWLANQDWPGHTEAARLLKKMQPPQLQESDPASPEALQAKLATLEQQMQQMGQQLQQAGQIIQTKQVESRAQVEKAIVEGDQKLKLAQLQAETTLAIEKMKTELAMAMQQMKGVEAKTLQDDQQRHDRILQDDEQRHEMALSTAEAHQASVEGERSRQADAQGDGDPGDDDDGA